MEKDLWRKEANKREKKTPKESDLMHDIFERGEEKKCFISLPFGLSSKGAYFPRKKKRKIASDFG